MALSGFGRSLALALAVGVVGGCTVYPPEFRPRSPGHLTGDQPDAVAAAAPRAAIPEPVTRSAFLPPPGEAVPEESYTVVVNDVPVRELMFALARDASINVDVHPDVQGSVTLNAIDQSLFQILDRIGRQLDLRYTREGDTIVVVPDAPFLRTYTVPYVNVTRTSSGTIVSSTLVSSVGEDEGGNQNTSLATINNNADNEFWETLASSLDEIVRPEAGVGDASQQRVILNREASLVLVRATNAQHRLVQRYLDSVIASATRQVLIEATIVEVQLNDRYQAGVDWTIFTRGGGLLGQGLTLGSDLATAFIPAASGVTGLILDASNAPDGSPKRTVEVSVSLLSEFGDTKVLSSPKIMTLNNQPAVLKVVDNEVYFDIDITTNQNQSQTVINADSEVRTVAVGLVMNVIPQIAENDTVTLNVRPTITRVREFVEDPAVPIALANAGPAGRNVDIQNLVPVVQVRETEAVMRVGSGQLAILGGLMQDRDSKDDDSVPGFGDLPVAGELFKFRDREQVKTELVIFLRPTVIRSPDVNTDLAGFQPYLPQNLPSFDMQEAPFQPVRDLSPGEPAQ